MDSLEEIGKRCGTDKGTQHSYLPIYDGLLAPWRWKAIRLLEIGVGKGASLRMWLEYFPLAHVTGLDCELPRSIGWQGSGPGDSYERLTLVKAWQEAEPQLCQFPNEWFDVIIDDGSHQVDHQLLSYHFLWRTLKQGGYYCVEDVACPKYLMYWRMVPHLTVHENHKHGLEDDILLVLRKPPGPAST